MSNEYFWESFLKSGRVDDYLKYKEYENKAELNNAIYDKGLSDSRTDGGRE